MRKAMAASLGALGMFVPGGSAGLLLASPTWSWTPQCTDPADPAICGQWADPVKLEWNGQEISCTSGPGGNDEIGHATLIPTGVHKGRLLIWTLWDDRAVRSSVCPYTSYIVDPSDWSVIEAPSFDPVFSAIEDGPFCSGHTWILDASGNPKSSGNT